jgi:phage N-6-adenine-methyltransferase
MTNTNHALPKGTSDEHYTPQHIFKALNLTFDLDPCSPEENNSMVPAKTFYTKKDNGLLQKWNGLVWMNPPYSKPAPWVEKFINHKNGIALLPITRGKWWDDLWALADGIIPTEYNLKFVRPDGLSSKPIVFRTALFAFGEAAHQALINSNLGRVR